MNESASRMPGCWLYIALPDLPLQALGLNADASTSHVVYAQHGARRWVVASGHPRIAPGESLGSVQARFPELRVLPRDRAAEAAALQAIAYTTYAISDRMTLIDEAPRGSDDLPALAIAVDIAPSLRLFGGIGGVLHKARESLDRLAYRYTFGVAPTLEAAAIAARAGIGPIEAAPGWKSALAAVPLPLLRWPLAAESLLRDSGHITLADVLKHDAASLAARLGPAFPVALRRLLGEAPDPRPWFEPPARYRRRFDLDCEIDDWQALLFPLKRLFDEFESYLRARQVTTSQIELTLARRRSEAERCVLRTTAPTQSAGVFLRLLRERWNARPPQAPASELRLRADRFVPLQARQGQLFDDTTSGEAWDELTDRLRARLGDAAVWQPGLQADHRPEHAWSPSGHFTLPTPLPARPMWLLPAPQPWVPPRHMEMPGSPERVEGGWWDEGAVARDYYRVRGVDGRSLWVFRDQSNDRWFIQGIEFVQDRQAAPANGLF